MQLINHRSDEDFQNSIQYFVRFRSFIRMLTYDDEKQFDFHEKTRAVCFLRINNLRLVDEIKNRLRKKKISEYNCFFVENVNDNFIIM